MARLEVRCRAATPFKRNGDIDEEALRRLLQRFIKSGIGVYLCSEAGGEGRTLTWEEMGRIYRIGLDECRGRIPVFANPPEQYSATRRREAIVHAADAGVDMVMTNVYSGMKLNDTELKLYFKDVLGGIRHPVSLAVNGHSGAYTPKAEVMAEICNTHRQIVAFNLSNGPDSYFVRFAEHLKREIDIYVHCAGSLNKLTMGANGVFGTEANIIPRTMKAYLDSFSNSNLVALGRHYRQIVRYVSYMSRWHPANPRAIKLAFRLLKLPGWEGGLRGPHCMLPDKDFRKFATGMLQLNIPEVIQQARAAGVRMP